MRQYSPLTQTAFDACGSNPTYSCVVGGSGISVSNNKIKDGCVRDGGIDQGNQKCSGSPMGGTTTIFANLAEIKRLTGKSKSACMALLGPDLDTTLQTQNLACATVSGGVCLSLIHISEPTRRYSI